MIKETIQYVDLNGNIQIEDHFFHLNKVEIARMQVKMDGKYIDYLKDLVSGEHVEKLFDVFYNLILDSYGEKSPDGKRFIKDPKKRDEFEESVAFSEFFTKMVGNMDKMAEFTKGVVPSDLIPEDESNINVIDSSTSN